METIKIDQDIPVFYVTASSFPEGIAEAHERLHALAPWSARRRYFGLSRPEDGGAIVYRAAAEELHPGEAELLGCKTLIVKKGSYICIPVHDYLKDASIIGRSFQTLLARNDLDPQGYCVEWYVNQKEMKCMIRLKD